MGKLNGPFSDIIPVLIKMKKSTGYKYNNIKNYIELDNFLYERGITEISQEIYNVAIMQEDNPFLKKKRYYTLENINVVLETLNIPVIKIGKIKLEKNEKFIARILTQKEIITLFSKIDNASNKLNNTYRELYPVLFRLLYSTGIRISEALSLTKADYTRDYGTLKILNSKNLVSRNVVLSNSMKRIFDKYINCIKNDNDLIFKVSYSTVRTFFQKIIIELSFEPCRIHDLRHMFAIYSLYNLKSEMEENNALYYLSVFMGHSNIESTVYYLQLTPKHEKEIINKMDKINKYIFKEEDNESK